MKRYLSIFLLILLIVFGALPTCPPKAGWAHDITDREVESVGNSIELGIWEDLIYVDYWIAIGDLEALNFYPLIDTDRNGSVSEEEKELFLERLEKDIVTTGVRIVLDNRSDLSFALYSSRMLLSTGSASGGEEKKNGPVPIKINFEFLLDLERLRSFGILSREQKEHTITFYMTNTIQKEVFLKLFIAQGEGINIVYNPEQRSQSLIFRSGFWLKPAEWNGISLNYSELDKKSTQPPNFNRNPKVTQDIAKQKLEDYLKKETLSWTIIIVGLFVAFLYGAGHSLTPGHGKTLVAAYLVGSRGTISQAIILGLVVTATHLSTVIIAGILALAASHYVNQTAFSVYLGIASGLVIVIMGVCLFSRRLTHPLGEHHHHNHEHELNHHHPEIIPDIRRDRRDGVYPASAGLRLRHTDLEKVSLKHIIALGISGGLIPCPTAIVVLLMAITLKKTLWGLFLILAFSLGLAGVLIIIGILMVGGISLIKPSERTTRLIRVISIISPVIITFIGIAIIISNLINSGVIILNPQALP